MTMTVECNQHAVAVTKLTSEAEGSVYVSPACAHSKAKADALLHPTASSWYSSRNDGSGSVHLSP